MNLVLEDVAPPVGGSDHDLDSMTTELRDVTEMVVIGKFLEFPFFVQSMFQTMHFSCCEG